MSTRNIGQPTIAEKSRFLTISMAAKILSVSGQTVWRLIYDGDMPAVRLGSLLRIPRSALEEFIGENFVKTRAR